jgi:hypothetical protein
MDVSALTTMMQANTLSEASAEQSPSVSGYETASEGNGEGSASLVIATKSYPVEDVTRSNPDMPTGVCFLIDRLSYGAIKGTPEFTPSRTSYSLPTISIDRAVFTRFKTLCNTKNEKIAAKVVFGDILSNQKILEKAIELKAQNSRVIIVSRRSFSEFSTACVDAKQAWKQENWFIFELVHRTVKEVKVAHTLIPTNDPDNLQWFPHIGPDGKPLEGHA